MVYGVISLISAQILILALTCTAYLRIRSHSDAEKHERVGWEIKVEAAVATAGDAKRQVEMIELSHYKALLAKFEAQNLEISGLEKEVASLRNEVTTLRTRHASESRAERMSRAKEIAATGPESVEAILEDAKKNGTAYVMPPAAPPVPQNNPRRFGAVP